MADDHPQIDPVTFGRLLQSVEQLSDSVTTLSKKVDNLDHKMADMNLVFFGSKWFAVGLLITAGGAGAGVLKIIEHLPVK